jgi:hypothetical protein
MAAIVGIDARVDLSTDGVVYNVLSERNEFSISISVDIAERRPFVASLSDAWVFKARTWMNWSGSLNGYYDDADDTIFDTMKEGAVIWLRFYSSRATLTKYWQGQVILSSVEHGVTTEDFATLTVDFEGSGALTRVSS